MESLGLCCVLPLHCDSFCRISPTDGVLMEDGNFLSQEVFDGVVGFFVPAQGPLLRESHIA